LIRPDRGDRVADDRECFSKRTVVVHRDDLAAAQHQVGRPRGRARLSLRGGSRGKKQNRAVRYSPTSH